MVNLREQAEADLGETLEKEWGLPVVLIDPDGVKYTTSANDPTAPLMGQVLYGKREYNPDTGQDVYVNTPVITLRVTSLARIPVDGERWGVQIPVRPSLSAPMVNFIFEGRPVEGGASLGIMRIYPQKAAQA